MTKTISLLAAFALTIPLAVVALTQAAQMFA
jgi:hypothetical protein